MNTKIQDLNISSNVKRCLHDAGFVYLSDLEGHNYITLVSIIPSIHNVRTIVEELNSFGYCFIPESEISVADVPMSKRLQNVLERNYILYLSQLSTYPEEEILQFRNLGEKTYVELAHICQEYNIHIGTLQEIKENLAPYKFPPEAYTHFFKHSISCLNDFRNKSACDLYAICDKNYLLTNKIYYILKENGIIFNNWHDQYLFEIIPKAAASQVYKRYFLCTVSAFSSYSECERNEMIKKFPTLSMLPISASND